jgi:hypothetical protein
VSKQEKRNHLWLFESSFESSFQSSLNHLLNHLFNHLWLFESSCQSSLNHLWIIFSIIFETSFESYFQSSFNHLLHAFPPILEKAPCSPGDGSGWTPQEPFPGTQQIR